MKTFIKVHLKQSVHKRTVFSEVKCVCSTFTRNKNTLQHKKLTSAYVPKNVEKDKYKAWEKNNFFKPKFNLKDKFSIILPPPNVTGTLHLGHALTIAIEDSIVRWHRMRNHSTVWVPGLDHAGIATQVVVEKKLLNETKQSRHDVGREKFIDSVQQWKREKGTVIEDQLRQLGASLDWDRFVFTMDSHQTNAVIEAFIKLYEKGLIYRSKSLVNWSCSLQSAISDIELEQLDINGPTNIYVPGYMKHVQFGVLYKFAYKIHESDEEIIVATTRPETMVGDVAIAVHPNDDRYSHLRGKFAWHPFRNELIPIIYDDFVDCSFGTGAVKITPGHDRADFEAAKRHALPILEIIDEKGLIKNADNFNGQKRFDARDNVLNRLHEMSMGRGMEDHKMILPICTRSSDVIEYLLKPQWFVDSKDMARKAINAVKSGELVIEPKVFERNWFDWLENIRDWNISRQLWWGHRIPAYQCRKSEDSEEKSIWIAAKNDEAAREKALNIFGTDNLLIIQDEDVLDTWFSSGLMPFSVFGWPKQTSDLKEYYPLSMIETGHDILFFWIARMVMLGVELTGQLPFTKILLHGIICDADGRKMSKSLGNVISPEDIIHGVSLKELNNQVRKNYETGILSEAEYKKAIDGQKKMFPNGIPACGADSLRFTLCSHNIKNHFINFDVNECNTNRLFCNKIWQATKYTQNALECVQTMESVMGPTTLSMSTKSDNLIYPSADVSVSLMDQWILSRLSYLVEIVNKALENAELHMATGALKTFFYTEFCDIYVECTKSALKIVKEQSLSNTPPPNGIEENNDRKIITQTAYGHCVTLSRCLEVGLRCLAPFMPYMTEELYSRVSAAANINDANFPLFEHYKQWRNVTIEYDVSIIMELVVAIRRMRSNNIGSIMTTPQQHRHQPPVATEMDAMKKKQNQLKSLVYIETLTPSLYNAYLTDIKTLAGVKCKIIDSIQSIITAEDVTTVSDTVGSQCTIHALVRRQQTDNDNMILSKKEMKLIKEIDKLHMATSQEGYILKATERVKNAHLEKMKRLKDELNKIQMLRKSK